MKLHRTSTFAPIKLDAELGRGGEGTVFAVHAHPNLVAKIYAKPPMPQKVDKLQAMARAKNPSLLQVAAWPIDLLVDEKRQVRGFLMPKVSSRSNLHELYSPKSRASTFPDTDFRFLVHAAANVARAFALVHSQGHVIGDVNHGNALVGRDGTIVLIDCDSFQIRDRIKTFSCDVGVPLFTAPELQGMAFRGLRRSPNHDAFGLAVVIFHLLFQGRHPFAGVYDDGEITIERAIAEHRFAYSTDSERTRMKAPPGTLSLGAFGRPIAELFTRALQQPASAGARPTAMQWIDALEALERSLVQCATTLHHFHPSGSACCWCSIERRTGLRLFGRRMARAGRAVATDLESLWKSIVEVPHPGPAPLPPTEPVELTAREKRMWFGSVAGRAIRFVATLGAMMCLFTILGGLINALTVVGLALCVGLVIKFYPSIDRYRIARFSLEKATKAWTTILQRWNEECSSAKFDQTLAELKQANLELRLLAERRKQELERLVSTRAQQSLTKYLSAIPINDFPLHQLTRSQRARLMEYGIRTAADIDRDQAAISNLLSGPAAQALIAWYRMHMRNFQPLQPEPQETAAIERRFDYLEQRLAQQLRDGPERLRQQREKIVKSRKRLKAPLQAAWKDLSRAQQQQQQ